MRKSIISAMSIALVSGLSIANAETVGGEIMDSQCAKMGSHEMMMKKESAKDAKECTLKCVQMGGKFVLYDAATKTVYQLDDQDKPKEFAGQKVEVSGSFDNATKTIHVESIKATP